MLTVACGLGAWMWPGAVYMYPAIVAGNAFDRKSFNLFIPNGRAVTPVQVTMWAR